MFRLVPLAAFAVALLGNGCSSTLNEYQCVSSADCVGAMAGQCEASGHCSFADDSCESGFRFGDNAGSETDSCVEADVEQPDARADAEPVDAGLPDAIDSFAPVARITDLTFDCDRTNEEIIGTTSEAFDGRSLTLFEWTVRDSQGQELFSFAGAPLDNIFRNIHERSGTYSKPRINVTQYHNRHGIRVDVTRPTSVGGEALTQQLNFSNNQAPHRVSFAIASDTLAPALGATFRLLDSGGTPVLQQAIAVTATMVGYSFETPAMGPNIPQPMTLEFRFDQAARFWVDNASVTDLNDGDSLVDHGSGEFGPNQWDIVDDTTSVQATIADLPASLEKNGVYTIELRVTDSAEIHSLVDSVEVTVADCP